MLGLLITLLVIIGLSCVALFMTYMRTRDLVAQNVGGDEMNDIATKQGYAIILHVIAILIMVVKIGTLMV